MRPNDTEKGTGTMAGPLTRSSLSLAFRNNWRRRRGFALAVRRSVLCEGRDAEESHRRCRQYSECFHGTLLCHDNQKR